MYNDKMITKEIATGVGNSRRIAECSVSEKLTMVEVASGTEQDPIVLECVLRR